MKEQLITFAYGLAALAIIGTVVYTIAWLFGEGALVAGLVLVIVWGLGATIRETIEEMKNEQAN